MRVPGSPTVVQAAAALLFLLLAACGGGGDGNTGPGPTNPPVRVPASVTFEGGSTATGTVGVALPAVTVLVRTADGLPVARASVSFSVSAGSLASTSAQTDDAGRASSGAWTLGTTAGTQTLTATAGPASGALVVTARAGTAVRLEFVTAAPATVRAGVPMNPAPSLRAVDQFNNATTGVQVSATIQTGGGTISGGSATADAAGVATFTGLSIGGTIGTRVLAFSSQGLPVVASGAIAVDPGLASAITLTNVPATARAGIVVVPAVEATVSDAFGNALTKPSTAVTISMAQGGGSVAGGTATTDATGKATFPALAVEGLIGDKRLRVSADQASVTTGIIPLFAGPAASLAIAFQPARTDNAAPFAQPIRVQVADRFGNAVGDVRDVTAAIASGGGAIVANTVRSDAAGVATFSLLKIVGLSGPRTLSFAAAGLTSALTAPIQLDPGPVRGFVMLQPPSPVVAHGVPFAQQPVLQAADTSGNLIKRSGILVRATLLDASGELLNESTLTDAAGVATYQQLTYLAPGTLPPAFRLRFSSGTQAVLTTGSVGVQLPVPTGVSGVLYGASTRKLYVMDAGTSLPLTAAAFGPGGAPMPGVPMVYTSANAAVVDVASNGTLRAMAPGSAWVRAFGAGSPSVRDSVYVTVPRDATGPVVMTTQLVPIVVRPGLSHDFDLVLDTRGTTVGAATILVGVPQELVKNSGIAWQGSPGTQIGFDTGFNTLRISYVNATGATGQVVLAKIRINTGQPDFFVDREIVITPQEVVSVNLVNLAGRATGVNIPLVP